MPVEDRPYKPSAAKRDRALQQGRVARSWLLPALAVWVALVAALFLRSKSFLGKWRELWTELFSVVSSGTRGQPDRLFELFFSLAKEAGVVLFFAALAGAATMAWQQRAAFNLLPSFLGEESKNPGKRRKFDAYRSVTVIAAIGVVLAASWYLKEKWVALTIVPSRALLLSVVSDIVVLCFAALAAFMLVDVWVQKKRHELSLRMTRQERDDELRAQHRSPDIAGRQRSASK